MRLDERSVERLYARGSEECAAKGSAMRRLVLHVRAGEASGTPLCDEGGGAAAAGAADAPQVPSPFASTGKADRPASISPSFAHGAAPARAARREADMDTQSDLAKQRAAVEIAVRAEAAKHALETEALMQRNMALSAEVSLLQARVTELQAALWRWRLVCFVLAGLLVLTLVGAAYVAAAYTASLIKLAVWATIVATAATTALVLACMLGYQSACQLQYLLLEGLRWIAWLASSAAWQLWQLAQGMPTTVAALIVATALAGLFAVRWGAARRCAAPRRLKDAATDPVPLAEDYTRASPELDEAALVTALRDVRGTSGAAWAEGLHVDALRQLCHELTEALRKRDAAEHGAVETNAAGWGVDATTASASSRVDALAASREDAASPASHNGEGRAEGAESPLAEAPCTATPVATIAPAAAMAAAIAADSKATRSFSNKHKALYASERDLRRYDADICRRQDHAGNLLAEINRVVPLTSAMHIVDVGCGTGKLARLVATSVGRVSAYDRAREAISVAEAVSPANVTWGVADLRQLPVTDSSAHVVLAGWAISYLKVDHEEWYQDGSSGGPWREQVNLALTELERVLVPGGVAIIFETLGTATEQPQRSGSWLYAHYRACGLEERCVRTDYRFSSQAQATETLTFFFGRGVATRAAKLMAKGASCIVPECTGMWWFTKGSLTLGPPPAPAPGCTAE